MTRALTRTNFHHSRLIRVLADLAMLDAAESATAFAEKLGQWLDLNDAITLYAVHNASASKPPVSPSRAESGTGKAIGDELTRVRTALVSSITKGSSPRDAKTRAALPAPQLDTPLDAATAFEPYRRYYLTHQRDMDTHIGPLRAQVREVLAKASPALRTLAALDSVFDGMLCEREGKLLARLPGLLEQRFDQLLQTHQPKLVDTAVADTPAQGMTTGAWLVRFGHELQTVLLAELDVRLQPTLGLIEAFNNDTKPHHTHE